MKTNENKKNLVIVTSFGCNKKCPHCISKLHPILSNSKPIEETNLDWNKLEVVIKESSSETITLIGGGDPFFNWEANKKFFEKLVEISKKYKKKLEVTTKTLPMDISFVKQFDKINYLVEYDDRDHTLEILKRSSWWFLSAIRVDTIQIIDNNIKDRDIYNLIGFLKRLGIQKIVFKEMFGGRYTSENFESLKNNIESIEGVDWVDNSDDLNNTYYFLIDEKIHDYIIGDSLDDRNSWKKTYEAFAE